MLRHRSDVMPVIAHIDVAWPAQHFFEVGELLGPCSGNGLSVVMLEDPGHS